MTRLVIFDLDGTLLDTIADLAASTNYALSQLGYPTHPQEAYPLFVGNGVSKLFERALPEAERSAVNVARMRSYFVPHYDAHNADRSCPYAGIPELLKALRDRGIGLAVASNKYQAAVEKLMAHYFAVPFAAILGQREGVPVKPDPAIVETILATTGVAKSDVLYVGDSGVDMQTAGRAGVAACGVTWGFRPRTELEQFHPQHIVDRPSQILDLLS